MFSPEQLNPIEDAIKFATENPYAVAIGVLGLAYSAWSLVNGIKSHFRRRFVTPEQLKNKVRHEVSMGGVYEDQRIIQTALEKSEAH